MLCSDVSDNSRYVRPGVTGFLFDPHDPVSMADAIRQAMDSGETTLRKMGLNGRSLVQDALSASKFRESYRLLIDSMTSSLGEVR